MNNPTRPPLYAYQKAYKTQIPASFDGRVRRKRLRLQRFTDEEYNEMISLMGSAYRATVDGKHNFVITTNQGGRLKQLLKSTGVVQPVSITVLAGNVRLNYPINRNGVAQCTADLNKIQNMIESGVITTYDPVNPTKAYTGDGKTVKNLTQSKRYSQTIYEDDETGERRVVSKDTSDNLDQLLKNSEENAQSAQLKNYLLIGLVAIALIIMVWTVKKSK